VICSWRNTSILFYYFAQDRSVFFSFPGIISQFITNLAEALGGAMYRFPWLMMVGLSPPPMAYMSQCV
jgi:hypothetical protein